MLILSRHSLSYYLLHQPVLLASFAVILRIVRGAWPV
jgi:membrane-bound acyltransferase YfiQ involved in biofilm formation